MLENAEGSDRASAEIAAVLAEQDAAWNRGDAAAFAARVLPEMVFTNVVGAFLVGHAAFLAQHERLFATIYKGSVMQQRLQHLTMLKPDVAIVDTLAIGTGMLNVPPGISLIDGAVHSRLEQVMLRKEDGWWIASFHNVAVNPMFAGGGPPPRPS